MRDPSFRPGHVALAAVVIGSALVVMLPQHAMSIMRLVILTVGVAAALFALGVNAPPTWWRSPFDRRRSRRRGIDEIDRIRSYLTAWRQPVPNGPALPPEVVNLLRQQLAASDEVAGAGRAGGDAMSPLSRAIMQAEPKWRPWQRRIPPNGREVAAVVDAVLDEIERPVAVDVSHDRVQTLNPRRP